MKPVKNLLLQDKGGQKYLVVMAGNERLDLKALKETLGARKLQFASDETLFGTFGVKPGAVSVFGMLHPGASNVKVVVDEALLADNDEISFHPNDNTASVFFAADKLEAVLQKIGADYTISKLY